MAIIDKPTDYFDTVIYSGNGGTQSITSLDFQPNFLWGKQRNVNQDHVLLDSIRGTTKQLYSSDTSAEQTNATGVTSFNSDGFSLGSSGYFNNGSNTYVAWNWKAGTSFTNDASATGIGTIDSTGSVNTDAGFSIISYTGNGSAGATIAHGLGVAPAMIIQKIRSSTGNWLVYHHKNTSAPATEFLRLNTTDATADELTIWNDTAPTSSVFSVGTESTVNGNGTTFIAYCFAEKQSYSKFGSYVGNGNVSGSYIHLGFKPAFLITKRTDSTGNWLMYDNKRIGYNPSNYFLYSNLSNSEITDNPEWLDLYSNGFKIRATSATINASGGSYIYMAFAENPFVTSTGVPATAR